MLATWAPDLAIVNGRCTPDLIARSEPEGAGHTATQAHAPAPHASPGCATALMSLRVQGSALTPDAARRAAAGTGHYRGSEVTLNQLFLTFASECKSQG